MILSALNDYYQRLLEQGADGVSPFGYSQEKISYEMAFARWPAISPSPGR